MSMRGSIYSIMAMAAIMGGVSGSGMSLPRQRYKPQPRKLSPEEEVIELEKRRAKFLLSLEKHNSERMTDFPKWKQYDVHGFSIIASSEKNAIRDIGFLLNQSGIYIELRDI